MSECKVFEMDGSEYTLNELAEMSCIPKNAIAERLRNGWDVKAAIQEPEKTKVIDVFRPEMYANGNITIYFARHIAGVFKEMQPELGKLYDAEPHYQAGKRKTKLYYIIYLDNGKPLIVYPGEFEWVSEQAA